MRMKVRTLEGREKTPESPLFYCESGYAPRREQLFAEFTVVHPTLALSAPILHSIIHLTKVEIYKVITGWRKSQLQQQSPCGFLNTALKKTKVIVTRVNGGGGGVVEFKWNVGRR